MSKAVYYVVEELTGEPFAVFSTYEKAKDYVDEYNDRGLFTGNSLDDSVHKIRYNPTLKNRSIFDEDI